MKQLRRSLAKGLALLMLTTMFGGSVAFADHKCSDRGCWDVGETYDRGCRTCYDPWPMAKKYAYEYHRVIYDCPDGGRCSETYAYEAPCGLC